MSDFAQQPGVPPGSPPSAPPPPPPPGATGSPFGAPSAPPQTYPPQTYPPQGYPPQGYPVQGYAPGFGPFGAPPPKPPRPAVTTGSVVLIVGGILLAVGAFLPWYTFNGSDYTGFTRSSSGNIKDGPIFLFLGIVALGAGIAQLVARKILAVAIVAIVFAVLAIMAAFADISDVKDVVDLVKSVGFGMEASMGPGLFVALVGAFVALAGGIATVSKRRR